MELFNILGHEVPKRILRQILEKREFFHFYLFTGPPGVGKGLIAREFAWLINCEKNDILCKNRISKNLHPDVKIIKEKNIKIAQIRELQEDIFLAPIEKDKKIIIIEDAETLTLEAANALLKTLEEPPPNTIFILTSSFFYLLPETIVSRAQVIQFSQLSKEEVTRIWHERLNKNQELPVYDGTLHFMETMNLREKLFELYFSVTEDSLKRKVYEVLNFGTYNRNLKEMRKDIINIWFSFLHDIYLPKDGIINLYKKERIISLRKKVKKDVDVPYIFEVISLLEKGMIFNISFNIWWEYLILSTYDILFGG